MNDMKSAGASRSPPAVPPVLQQCVLRCPDILTFPTVLLQVTEGLGIRSKSKGKLRARVGAE